MTSVPKYSWREKMGDYKFSTEEEREDEKGAPVIMSDRDVKVPEFLSSGKDRMGWITERYNALGVDWEKCPLRWDSKTGKKAGMLNGMGKDHDDWNGWKLSMGDNMMAIDVDGDCEKCAEVSALCDAVCVWKQKTRKGYHYIFKKDPRIKQCQPNRDGVAKIDTRVGKGGYLFVAPSFYHIPDVGRVEYKLERIPETIEELTECPEKVIEYFLTIPDYCAKKVETQANASLTHPSLNEAPREREDEKEDLPIRAPTTLGEIELLCSCLTPEWLHDHGNWLRLMLLLKGISASNEMRDIFLEHSARAPAYKDGRKKNLNEWNNAKPNGRISMGSLKHWAKKCSPEKYFANAKRTYWDLVNNNNAISWCEIFYNEMAGDIFYSNSHKCYYVYDARETIWRVSENNSHINYLFVEITSAVFRKMIGELPSAVSDDDTGKRKAQMKKLIDAGNTCGGAYVITLVNSFLPAMCRGDDDPATYFNQNPDLYPLLNGVWQFSKKKLIPYDREHYFTFRVPIAYNPKADMTDIKKASMDWFAQDAEVANFIQYQCGYCLTGYTTRQELLIVWGNLAGNGKSLLWGKIMGMLLDKYYSVITSDALSSERVGNNDQLYNLNGKRFAFLSEPRSGRASKMDNEVVKNLTGDEKFTAEAKYKGSITFQLTAKVVMVCNAIPDIKFEDHGTHRRIKIAEQNSMFVDPADYEKACVEQEEKVKAKKILLKDDAFIARLLANVEGLMRWALEGASLYIDDPRKGAPQAMCLAKAKAEGEGDALGIWIRGHLRNLTSIEKKPEDWKKRKITFRRVKEMMNGEGLGQRQQGFNRRLKEKLESLGFEVGGREEKGDLYIKRTDEEVEEAIDEE